jgi:putative Mg2+ transporter-C (MgtC) family protein
MIISVYGFEGVLTNSQMRLDVSRIAAQVVSGIGFLGAGTIIFQKNAVHGLTTAAGVWATAAIGLACGVGMYLLALSATFLVLVGLEAFNYLLKILEKRQEEAKEE